MKCLLLKAEPFYSRNTAATMLKTCYFGVWTLFYQFDSNEFVLWLLFREIISIYIFIYIPHSSRIRASNVFQPNYDLL